MDEIKRRDTQVFVKELTRFPRLFVLFCASLFAILAINGATAAMVVISSFVLLGSAYWAFSTAHKDGIARRFYDPRFAQMWRSCEDRVKRLKSQMSMMRKSGMADMTELPRTIDKLAADLYVALRKADIVMREATESEKDISHPQPYTLPERPDKHAQELLRVADRNIAEYNTHLSRVFSGVQRTEAQAMVFVTTLDSLRARILSQQTMGRAGAIDSSEFLLVVKEAKMQLDAIDRALEEIDEPSVAGRSESDTLRQNISKSPPPIPERIRAEQELRAGLGEDPIDQEK